MFSKEIKRYRKLLNKYVYIYNSNVDINNIILNYLYELLIQQFIEQKNYNWNLISKFTLSCTFIKYNIKDINWDILSENIKLPTVIISKYIHKVNWINIYLCRIKTNKFNKKFKLHLYNAKYNYIIQIEKLNEFILSNPISESGYISTDSEYTDIISTYSDIL